MYGRMSVCMYACSFGEVYRVRSRVDGVEYAVKCTRHRFKGHAHRDRYLQEVKALAKVCNSDSEEVLHIVRYHQAWIEDERLYMQVRRGGGVSLEGEELTIHLLPNQTELCETSLDKRLMVGLMLTYDEVFSFLRQMLLALDILHRNGLVHLDIKVSPRYMCGHEQALIPDDPPPLLSFPSAACQYIYQE